MTKYQVLKQAAEAAQAAYESEQARLAAAGLKSKDRYELLKPLKADLDEKWAAMVKANRDDICRELDKIIEADRPAREAAARARSPWKQAKFDAAKARGE